MKFINYDDIIEKLTHCAYANRKVDTWENIIAIINEVPTVSMDCVSTEVIYDHETGNSVIFKLYEVVE